MAMQLTAIQKRHIEGILAKVQYYLDLRYAQARRFNPNLERSWEDLASIQMNTLRASLTADKMFGPVRYNVAEVLVGDDMKKRQEFFLKKSQNCLQAEIVENKESDGHKTHGAMEIHDMRTLCSAIDKSLEMVVTLIQTFIWWDLEDAVDWLRVENKLRFINRIEESGLSDELAQSYRELLQMDHTPSAVEVLQAEAKSLKTIIESLRQRRALDGGYQIIFKRDQAQTEQPEVLIDAIAGQQNLLKTVKGGQALSPAIHEQIAKGLNVEVAEATPERVRAFLESMIAQNRKRLRDALNGMGTGAMVNVKAQQLAEFEAFYGRLVQEKSLAGE
ncbi:hypothetical protein GC173_13950 [bacterium]|nr:hypothetical protein [bacterium]